MYLITKWFGTFLCSKSGVKNSIFFPKDVNEISKRLECIEGKKILSEEKQIAKNTKKLIVSEKRLQSLGLLKPNDPFFKSFEIDFRQYGFDKSLLNKAMIKRSTQKIKKSFAGEDVQLVQLINTIDELLEISNLLSERLNIWSKLYENSLYQEPTVSPIINLSNQVSETIQRLEQRVKEQMNLIAPNISMLAGPIIGARLISLASNLHHLASLPSSTVQLLGAEKALFRYKKEGGKPPKHGVIFQHSFIKSAPKNLRGKIARAFAAKISIAAKADAFTKRDIAKELKQKLYDQIKAIKHKQKKQQL